MFPDSYPQFLSFCILLSSTFIQFCGSVAFYKLLLTLTTFLDTSQTSGSDSIFSLTINVTTKLDSSFQNYSCGLFRSLSIFLVRLLLLSKFSLKTSNMERPSFDSSNFRQSRLSSSDHIRFLKYWETVQQEIATHGATQYIQVGPTGGALYQMPNIQLLSDCSQAADERFFQFSSLQMNLAQADRTLAADFNNANLNHRQTIFGRLQQLAYDPMVEDPRLKFFEQKLTKGRKDFTDMTTAIAHIFRYLFATLDSFLANKIQDFASRTDAAHPPHHNLMDALTFLQTEMKGNSIAIKEACNSQIDKLRTATTLEEMRFVLDVFVSVVATVTSSIRLYGGNGLLTNSQIHYKLLSKMDPNAPSLTTICWQVTQLNPETATLQQIRAIIKPELDRVVDPLRSIARSNVLSNSRQSSLLYSYSDPLASSMSNLASSVEVYNMEAPPLPQSHQDTVDKAVQQAVASAFATSNSRPFPFPPYNPDGNSSSLQSNYTGAGSTGFRPKPVCTAFLYGTCGRSEAECRFDHPAALAKILKPPAEGTNASSTFNAASNKSRFSNAPTSISNRPTSPRSQHKISLKSSLGKRSGSPVADRQVQFKSKAFSAEYDNGHEEEEGDEQREEYQDQEGV